MKTCLNWIWMYFWCVFVWHLYGFISFVFLLCSDYFRHMSPVSYAEICMNLLWFRTNFFWHIVQICIIFDGFLWFPVLSELSLVPTIQRQKITWIESFSRFYTNKNIIWSNNLDFSRRDFFCSSQVFFFFFLIMKLGIEWVKCVTHCHLLLCSHPFMSHISFCLSFT